MKQQRVIEQYRLSYTLVKIALKKQLTEPEQKAPVLEEKVRSDPKLYSARVHCSNCKWVYTTEIPWGEQIYKWPCTHCGCKDLYCYVDK
jgi:hypothetical protein